MQLNCTTECLAITHFFGSPLLRLLLVLCSSSSLFRSLLLLGILSFIFKLSGFSMNWCPPFRWYLGPPPLMFSLECSDRNCCCILGRGEGGISQMVSVWHLELKKLCKTSVVGTFSCIVVVAIFFHQMKIFCNVQFFPFREIARKYALGWYCSDGFLC